MDSADIPVDEIVIAATELRAAVEQLASDDTQADGAFEALVAQSRALGERWAGLAEAERVPSEVILSQFAPWLDLEDAFLAGTAAEDSNTSEYTGVEAYEEQVAEEILQAQKDCLMSAIPGLDDWCRAHLRASHHGGSVLFTCADGSALIEAVSLVVQEDAEIDWAGRNPNGCCFGPFRVTLPRRGWSTEGLCLLDAIVAAQCRLTQESNHA